MPVELEAANAVRMFGAAAVFGGRAASASELRTLSVAMNVAHAFDDRAAAESWAEWSKKNPDASHLLNEARELAEAMHGNHD